ncbi:acyltransferase family protein [Sphingomonas sp. Leaf4]|uniref:acyltransferase family protein n=1 Tax=Sphingomonas sp. Leaf4 TaxID=2876553 RepID=UPI001E49B8BE|nr:acyltransferase [Sphingomonas sp. Leaf4]
MTVEAMSPRARRFEYLDLLRLLCAMAVVIFHYGVVGPYTKILPNSFFLTPNILVYGQFGVEVFFIISGFVISLSARNRGAIAFLWARILRLYPAYWICCTLTALSLIVATTGHETLWKPDWVEYLANMTMLQSFVGLPYVDPVYWSLAAELRFYALVTLLLALRQRVDSLPIIVGWTIACIVAPYLPPVFGKLLMVKLAPYFLAGMLIQRLTDLERVLPKLALLTVTMFLMRAHLIDIHAEQTLRKFFPFDPTIAFAIVITGAGLVTACAFSPSPRRFVPVMIAIGGATYPLYLLHSSTGQIILARIAAFLNPFWAALFVTTGVITVSLIISQKLEPQLRSWLRAIGSKVTSRYLSPKASS